jgi:hypothetical protein
MQSRARAISNLARFPSGAFLFLTPRSVFARTPDRSRETIPL